MLYGERVGEREKQGVRERKRVRVRKRERERERERCRICPEMFISKRNDGCLGTF